MPWPQSGYSRARTVPSTVAWLHVLALRQNQRQSQVPTLCQQAIPHSLIPDESREKGLIAFRVGDGQSTQPL